MRKASKILHQLGFKSQGSEGAKMAFVKHLNRAAQNLSVQNISTTSEQKTANEQLAFADDVLGFQTRRRTQTER